MPEPSVSICLPCYNAEATVLRAVQSIQSQTLTNWELIAVDDGSTDGTASILTAIAKQDARIIFQPAKHRGVTHTANMAMQVARAPLIARMDADDVARQNRLEKQIATLAENPTWGAVSSLVSFAGDRNSAGGYAYHVDWANRQLTSQAISLSRFIDLPTPNPSLMFRKEMLDDVGFFRHGDFPEDYELFLRWHQHGITVGKVNEVLLDWHDPPSRLTRNDGRYDPEAFHRCKAPYLARAIEKTGCSDRELWIVGAGRPARKLARHLEAAWRPASGFIDADPAKIGRMIHGKPVVSMDNLPAAENAVIVSFIASRGVGDLVRSQLAQQGRTEGIDFWIAA